jgi:uncharacterized circularly permuted ATP-grasp superfamily protein
MKSASWRPNSASTFRFLALSYFFLLLVFGVAPEAFANPRTERIIAEAQERAKANAGVYYDEVFDENGKMRPHYQQIFPLYASKTKAELEEIRRQTLKSFQGDNALSALPRVMPRKEFEQVKAGVEQRGRALLKFLQDHYSGQKNYVQEGVIPAEVIKRIVERADEQGFEGKLKPELIRFMYGPDIIRDADGIHRVLEDNTSYLGGQGDLPLAKNLLYRTMPEIALTLEKEGTVDPMEFYKNLLSRYRNEMKNPKEKIVIFAIPPYPDMEDKRLKKIWGELGVEWVIPGGKRGLVKKEDGMYLRWKEAGQEKFEKVGFVIFNTEFFGADNTFPVFRERWLREAAADRLAEKSGLEKSTRAALEKAVRPNKKGEINYQRLEAILRADTSTSFDMNQRTVPGLIDAIVSGQVLSNNTPGTEFVNDKEFNTYVEDLIRHYLKEEPILRNLPSQRLYTQNSQGERVVDEKVFRELEQSMDKYVVKIVDGRGGEGVWVGPKLSPADRRALLKKLRADTSREIIVQDYKHPSVLGPDIVDLRVLSQVGGSSIPGQEVYVPNQGWVRGVSMAGDGKVNLSAGSAHEVTFVVSGVEEQPKRSRAFRAQDSCGNHYARIQRSP